MNKIEEIEKRWPKMSANSAEHIGQMRVDIQILLYKLEKLGEIIEKHHKGNMGFGHTPGTMDYELYKTWEEVRND